MSLLSRTLEALTSGLYVTLLAPPVAAVAFALVLAIGGVGISESMDTSIASLLLLALGFATGAYFLGAIPAFIAGLALPFLIRNVSRPLALLGCGLIGVLAYLLTFGSHLRTPAFSLQAILTYTGPAFIGTLIAAYALSKLRTTEA